jgi:hypothetical protein
MFRGPSWLRRAGVTLLLWSLGAGTFAVPHAGDREADCAPIAVTHDESAHHIAAGPQTGPADANHCFLCHSLRSFYPAFQKFEHHHNGPRAERLHSGTIDCAGLVAWTLVPGRAPPV